MREFRPWDVWEGVPVPPFEPLQRLRAEAVAPARDGRTSRPATRDGRRRAGRRASSRPARLGASGRAERRFDRHRAALAGRVGGADRRHRQGSRSTRSWPRFGPAPLRVIKVPHHGSLTSSSSEFVQGLAPRVAVVSVGRSNSFGHPAPAVLQRYQDAGAAIFRTDRGRCGRRRDRRHLARGAAPSPGAESLVVRGTLTISRRHEEHEGHEELLRDRNCHDIKQSHSGSAGGS